MSGTAEPVRQPKNDAELARDVVRRLDSLENPTSMRAGAWVLSTSADGHLIASNVGGGSVIVARRPSGGENDPDAITDSRPPSLSATRTAVQTIAVGGSVVRFDGTEVEEGNWTGGQSLFDAVQVPVSGAYRVSGCVHAATHASNTPIGVGIRVDGQFRAGAKFFDTTNPWMTATVSRILRLTAGQSIDMFAYATTAVNIGAADWWTPGSPPTTLDINLVTERD